MATTLDEIRNILHYNHSLTLTQAHTAAQQIMAVLPTTTGPNVAQQEIRSWALDAAVRLYGGEWASEATVIATAATFEAYIRNGQPPGARPSLAVPDLTDEQRAAFLAAEASI